MAVALCLGGAKTVWEDLERAQALVGDRDHIIVACNFAGVQFRGHLDGWATLHPERMDGWRAERAGRGLNTDFRAFVHALRRNVRDVEVVPELWNGSSGPYMAQVALEAMGASGVILCGVPMDGEAGHIHFPGAWGVADRYRLAIERMKAAGLPVRSMSGWTAGVLGEPDAAWLDSLGLGPAKIQIRTASEAIMRVKFKRDRNWTPPEERRITIAYKDGWEGTIKRSWGEQMRDDGDLEEVDPQPRAEPNPVKKGSSKSLPEG